MKTIADRIESSIVRIPESGCWVWEKSLTNLGYARIAHNGKARHAHRVSFENYIGKVPDGLELDHLCKVRCCVNPNHLEPVTRYENISRSAAWTYRKARTHCPKGHELTDDNKYTAKSLGNKYLCLKCKIQRDKKYNRKGE
jgi:hypothetical protein